MARFTAFWMKDSTTVCETQKRLSNLCLKFLLMYNNSTEHPENLTTKPLIMPSNLSLLPFYTATILNSVIFQPVKTALSLDECIHLLDQFNSMPLNQLIQFVKGSQNDDQKFYVDFLTGLQLKLRYQQPWNVIPKLRSKIRSYWYQTNEQSTNPVWKYIDCTSKFYFKSFIDTLHSGSGYSNDVRVIVVYYLANKNWHIIISNSSKLPARNMVQCEKISEKKYKNDPNRIGEKRV